MWIRLPGILYSCFVCWICYLYKELQYNVFAYMLIVFLNMYNCIYFAELVVRNYGEHLQKNKINIKSNDTNKKKDDDILEYES